MSREKLERTKIIREKMKEVKNNPDIYYIGYWVDLAKELSMSPGMLHKVRRRIKLKEFNGFSRVYTKAKGEKK